MKLNKLLLFFLPTIIFANPDATNTIWVFSDGSMVASVLSFLYFLLNVDGKSSVEAIVKIAAVLGFAYLIIKNYIRDSGQFKENVISIKLIMYIVFVALIYAFFLRVDNTEKYKVYVLNADELNTPSYARCSYPAANSDCYAPLGIKLTMSFLTNLHKSSIEMMDNAFRQSDALYFSFKKAGLGFPLIAHEQMSNFKVTDVYKYQTFNDFYQKCLLFDFADGKKKLDDVMKTGNLISGNNKILSTNSRLTRVYSETNPNGILKQCFEVTIDDLIGSNVTCNTYAKMLLPTGSANAKRTFTGSGILQSGSFDVCDAISNYAKLAYNARVNSDEIIKQRVIINMLKNASRNLAFTEGATIADREIKFKFSATAQIAKEWIPAIYDIMQSFTLILIWVLAIMSIVIFSFLPIGYFLGFQLTLVVWGMMLNSLNYMVLSNLASTFSSIGIDYLGLGAASSSMDNSNLTFYTADIMDSKNANSLAFLSYMSLGSFIIAMAIVRYGAMAFGGFMSAIAQLAPGMHTVSSAAKGGTSFGTTTNTEQAVASRNPISGDYEKFNPDNSTYRSNMSNFSQNTQTDLLGNKTTTTSINGSTNEEVSTTTGATAGIKDGLVNNVSLTSGVSASMSNALSQSASEQVKEATSKAQTSSSALSNAVSDMQSNFGNYARAVSGGDNATANAMINNVQEEALSKTKQDMASHLEKAGVSSSLKGEIYSRLQAGYSLLGNEAVAGFSMKLGMSIEGTNHLLSQISSTYAKNLSDKMSDSVALSHGNTSTDTSTYANGVNTAVNNTRSSIDSYNESLSHLQATEATRSFIQSQSSQVNQDIATGLLQNAYNGGGIKGLKQELRNLENPSYFQKAANDYVGKEIQNNINTSDSMQQPRNTLSQPANKLSEHNLDEQKMQNNANVNSASDKNRQGQNNAYGDINKIDSQHKLYKQGAKNPLDTSVNEFTKQNKEIGRISPDEANKRGGRHR